MVTTIQQDDNRSLRWRPPSSRVVGLGQRAVFLAGWVLCWLAATILSLPAATRTFTNDAGGAWETASNWNPVGVPTATDSILITGNTVTITDTTADKFPLTLTVSGLTIDSAAGATLSINYTNTARALTVKDNIFVGKTGQGTLVLANGAIATPGYIYLGYDSCPTWVLLGTGAKVAERNRDGYTGAKGTMIVSNGSVRTEGLWLSSMNGATGIYEQYGGTNFIGVFTGTPELILGSAGHAGDGTVAHLLVAGGLLVQTNGGFNLVGYHTNDVASLTISNATVLLGGDANYVVGRSTVIIGSNGTLRITKNGLSLGYYESSTGTVLIAEQGMLDFQNGSRLQLGFGETGLGTITNRGTIRFNGNPNIETIHGQIVEPHATQ